MHREKKIDVDVRRHVFDSMVRNLAGLTRAEVERIVTEIVAEDRRFNKADLDQVIKAKRRLMRGQGLLEFVETPADLRDIGGLARLKRWLEVRRRALGREATDFGLDPPRGMLLLGTSRRFASGRRDDAYLRTSDVATKRRRGGVASACDLALLGAWLENPLSAPTDDTRGRV
jgi:hypothetical protein